MNAPKSILLLFLISLLLASFSSQAQMVVGTDTLYGNEWIKYDQDYFKIKVSEDGIYRISYTELSDAGVFLGADIPKGNQFNLIRRGEDIPIFTSTSDAFGNDDYFEFYGQKNRGETDAFLYENPEYQINPEYSLFTDTAVYFLTWNQSTTNSRIKEISNNLDNPPSKKSFCFSKTKLEYHNGHFLGKSYAASSDVSAKYDLGEGFAKSTFTTNQSFNIKAPQITNDGNALIDVRLQSGSVQHVLNLDLNDTNFVLDSFSNWAVKEYSFQIPASDLVSGNNVLKITGNASEDDKFRVANISLRYPHSFEFENKNYFEFELEGNNQPQYLEITNFETSGTPPVLYDLTSNLRIKCILENNLIKVVLPAFSGIQSFVLKSHSSDKISPEISKTKFTDFSNLSGDYIILTNSKLYDDGTGKNYVQEYADYRASKEGGNYNPVIVDVNQVYDQFGYGITRHEQSIRNFVHWSLPRWNPKLLFVIGKGVYYRTMRNNPVAWQAYDQVPSFGYPSSDNLLAAGHESNIPKIPVGRIAAYTPDMIRQYLEKVKELEYVQQNTPQTIEDRGWMKNILHLGGGTIDIQTSIRKELVNLEKIAEESTFGANVFSLFKNSTDVIQQATSEDVIDFINSGVSLITFFGHSAPNTLDFDIGDPSRYQNKGKYPFIYAMGCNTNRLFETRQTLSEQYVFVEGKGAITFIGSTATTSLSNLTIYGKEFYKELSNDFYGKPIGEIMKAVVEDYPAGGFWGELVQNNLMLHGDPALKINPHPAPDFLVNLEKTVTIPSFVNAQADSFQLDLTITNIGYAISDSIDILINHKLPNGDINPVDTFRFSSPDNEFTEQITIPLKGEDFLGENNLQVYLDYSDKITEAPTAAENNNAAEVPFIVTSNSAFPIYPPNFSIVNNPDNFELKASTANVFSKATKYYFQIDTSALFDSPTLQTSVVESKGGLMSWKPNLLPLDSTVYFWRVSIDSTETNGNGVNWENSSFILLHRKPVGWNQSHFYQKDENTMFSIETNIANPRINFSDKNIESRFVNAAFGVLNWAEVALFIDGFRVASYWPCPDNNRRSIQVLIIEEKSLDFDINVGSNSEPPNCYGSDTKRFIFRTEFPDHREKLITFLSEVPKNAFVFIFTTQDKTNTYHADQWAADSTTLGTNIFQVLEAQGATKVRDLATNQTPYIFIFQKDNPDWDGMREVHAADINDIIQTTTVLQGRQSTGSLTSPQIGPSKSWNSLNWKMTDLESHDFAGIDVFGVTKDGQDSLLHTNIQANDTTLAHINATKYPFLKLRLNLIDSVNYTPPQLDYWRVLYDPFPELALNPETNFNFHADTLQEGDKLKMQLAIQNVSEVKADSLLVKFSVKDKANNEQNQFKRYRAVPEGDSLIVNFETNTRGLVGKNLLTIEANPNEDQPEQLHFNNIGVLEFFVQKDARNPLLDVTFDGERIVNGDLISPTPEILIELKDENQFLALEDTTGFEIAIQMPDQTEYINIPIGSPEIEFIPANANDLDNNRAKIYYRPQLLEDGDYKLRVNGKDAAGNTSGSTAYEVAFKIINKSMISNMVNYPNPFSNSTRFVYTLTGKEVPANFKIQILTVSGRIVREVSQAEFGMMKIGTHLSDFVWDGTDEFGDPLANGVYLYRVSAKNATGEDIERYDSGADQFFTRNYGKMMLIR